MTAKLIDCGRGVTLERGLRCRMSDGVELVSDHYYPPGSGPHPTLLMRQPYGRDIASTVTYAHPVWFAGQRLPTSYANFYVANDRVLVPTFNDPRDRIAIGILADLFPSRAVVGIHAVDLVWGLGTLHCLTQQQPAKVL